MAHVVDVSFHPPESVLAGTVQRVETTSPGREGGEVTATTEFVVGGPPSDPGLAGSEASVTILENGRATQVIGIRQHGQVVGIMNASGSGVHFESDPTTGLVTSGRSFHSAQPPSD